MKGDVPRYILWLVIMMIVLIIGLVLFYLGGYNIIQGFLEYEIFG